MSRHDSMVIGAYSGEVHDTLFKNFFDDARKQYNNLSHVLRKNGNMMMKENRYYIQYLTEQVFLVRERLSTTGEPGPNDILVRSFSIGHDAHLYVDSVNEKQRKLDEQYGYWERRAYQPAI